jgi:hypothetical protein
MNKESRVLPALFLGLLSLIVFFLGQYLCLEFGIVGLFLMFVILAAYFFFFQFLLSRGDPDACRKDWRVMLALDSILVFAMLLWIWYDSGRWKEFLAEWLAVLISCCVGTFAGAVAASIEARRKAARGDSHLAPPKG